MGMGRRDQDPHERAITLTLKAKRNLLQAISLRIDQHEGFERARIAALEAITSGKAEHEIVVAAGDAYFEFVKETCGVEKQ